MTLERDHHTLASRKTGKPIYHEGQKIDVENMVWPTDWVGDIHRMHAYYGFRDKVQNLSPEELRTFLGFRINFLEEELGELKDNIDNPEEIVDALIDLCVVAIGTLDLFEIDAHRAWQQVDVANMSKEVGVKETRPNPLGLPDLVKPEGWEAPNHSGNYGLLIKMLEK